MKGGIVRHVVLAIVGVLMAVGLAGAQGPGAGTGTRSVTITRRQPPFSRAFRFQGTQGRWWNNPRVVEELKLTDDQRKAMDQILFQHRQQLINLQANLERANLDMQPLMNADVPNEAATDAQIDKVVQARADLERADARFLLALRMKLLPEQWKQVQNLRAHRAMMQSNPMMQRRPMPQHQWRQRPDGQSQRQGPPPSSPSSAPAQGPETPPAGTQQ